MAVKPVDFQCREILHFLLRPCLYYAEPKIRLRVDHGTRTKGRGFFNKNDVPQIFLSTNWTPFLYLESNPDLSQDFLDLVR